MVAITSPALKECLRLLSQRTNAMSLFKHIILAVVKHRGRCLAVSMIEHTALHACKLAVLEGQPWAHPYLRGNQNRLQALFFFFWLGNHAVQPVFKLFLSNIF